MLFEYALTVPAATLRTAPTILEAPLAAGTVVKVGVQFPDGCRNQVHVAIYRALHQVWPVNLDGDIASNDHVVEWPEDYDLDDAPFEFQLRAWSTDAAFSHVITFRFALLALETVRAARATPGLLERISRIILGR